MTESGAMSNRILFMLESIFKNNKHLQEFAIIPTEGNSTNTSPLHYRYNNIGLESWCIKHLFQHACSVLFKKRCLLSKRKVLYEEMEELNKYLIGALLINPDIGTFWNMKRELVEQEVLDEKDELYFCKIVLTNKPKSNESFAYRRWLLKRLIKNVLTTYSKEEAISFLQEEFTTIDIASGKAPNNYHSWNHRIWCMENIASKYFNFGRITYSELVYSGNWISTHVSEHAGYHYRQYLIKLVKKHKELKVMDSFFQFVIQNHANTIGEREYGNLLTYLMGNRHKPLLVEKTSSYVNLICILLHDLHLVGRLNETYPEHEALFTHRRFIMYHLLKVQCDYLGVEFRMKINQDKEFNIVDGKNITNLDTAANIHTDVEPNRLPNMFSVTMSKAERSNLYEILFNSERNFASHNGSVFQLAKYKKWLTNVVGFE
ncbi:protein prenyltransferase alpha subunit repeat-containing protein 1 [Diabrotica virgifera virgifera]|uniref:Protein prenyltransferase alpha subunit repeat-containing protein 1 n=1 Tax=Diabrotica virgifera virgifera TaxID=50390 RepID=A0A6P7GA68_DIAVI|nr:protein prenyltransferase alpha subunit repeat-containing protein 1 [Diabrotica virgifera virgifera]